MLVMVLQGLFLSCRSQINESDPSPEAGWTIVRRVSAGPLQAKPQPRIRTNPQIAVNIAAALVLSVPQRLGSVRRNVVNKLCKSSEALVFPGKVVGPL